MKKSENKKKMNPYVKERWVNAMKSGMYKQISNRLCDGGNGYCPFGVLVDIYAVETGTDCDEFLRHHTIPVLEVYEWANIAENGGAMITINGWQHSIIGHNDFYGHSFDEIADAIWEQL